MSNSHECGKCKGFYYSYLSPDPSGLCISCRHGNTPTCPGCGVLVPEKLRPDSNIWHPPIPRSEGQYMAAIELVGVTGMEPCTSYEVLTGKRPSR